MRYLLKNIKIISGITQTEGQFKGQPYEWLQADLFNDSDPFGNPARLPRFYCMTPAVIEMYKKAATPSTEEKDTLLVNENNLKDLIEKKTIPDITHIDNVFRYTHPLPVPYARVYRNDVINATNGQKTASKGDFIVGRQGEITPITSLPIYLKKTRDTDTGEWDWVEAPEIVARRILERSYKVYQAAQPVSVVATIPNAPKPEEAEATPLTPEEEAAALRAKLAALGQA